MATPTRQQLAQKATAYWLANSPLTTVGSYSALQGLANSLAALLADWYRDRDVTINEQALQAVFNLFDFSALSPLPAGGSVNLTGTAGALIPAGTTFSTIGSPGNAAVLFQTTSAVNLLAANPTTGLTLAQSAGSSSFTASSTVDVTYAWTNTAATGPTLAAPVTPITITTTGNNVTTSVTLPTGATGVNVYVGTTSTPALLASVSSTGTITYSGSASSGLAVTVAGQVLSLTISGVANGGSALPIQSYAGTATTHIAASLPGSAGNVSSGTISNIVTPVTGLVAVSNPVATAGGTDAESLAAQRSRFDTFKDSLSRATLSALETGALSVSGVEKVTAVERAYLTCFSNQATTWSDNTTEANLPKGVPFAPLTSPLAVGNAVYFGADRRFASLYFDVSTAGSGFAASWQYLNSAGNWVALTTTTDQTSNGQTSGTVAWTVPSDWAQGTVNGSTFFWIRLYVTSGTVTTIPQWYQILTLDPPPGYVYVYVQQVAGASNVLSNLQTTLNSWRGAGITVISSNANTQTVNVTLSITPTAYGALQPLQSTAATAITNLISNLAIGAPLPLSLITYTISSLYAGQAVAEVQITTPTADVLPGVDTLLLPGTVTVNILSPAS